MPVASHAPKGPAGYPEFPPPWEPIEPTILFPEEPTVLMSFTCAHAFIYKRLKVSIPNASKKHLLLKRNSKDTYTLTSCAHIDWVLATSGKHKKESLTTFIASLMLTLL